MKHQRGKNAMWQTLNRCLKSAALGAMLMAGTAHADALITDFNNFTSDALYPSWALPSATVVSGATSYSITATGYGSNYKYIGFPAIIGAGNTDLELTVALSGPVTADGHLGPIVGLIDGDGTHYNYAWYGQTLGSHVLTAPVAAPSGIVAPGSTPGLDLDTLTHMHMQLDPGGFGTSGQYTVEWQNLRLTGAVPEPTSLALAACCGALMVGARRRRASHV
jgi:hypothetical protein